MVFAAEFPVLNPPLLQLPLVELSFVLARGFAVLLGAVEQDSEKGSI